MIAFPYSAFRPEPAETAADLIQAVTSQLCQDAAHSGTLPPAAYLSPSFFELERDILFKPGWIAVAHVSQLHNPDDCTVELFGERVTAGRTEAEISAIAWAKDGSSRSVRTEVVDGLVYVNLDGDAAPLAPQLAPLSARFARLRLDDLEPAFRMDYESTFNWKILAETFMECYHHAGAHPGTFQVDFPTRLAGVGEHDDLWTSGYSTARDDVSQEELWTGLPVLADDYSDFERRSFFLYHIYPNQIMATLADRLVWFRNQPVAPNATKLQVFVLVRPHARDAPGYGEIMARDYAFFSQVNDEDIAANESQQFGLGAGVAEPGRLSHLEGSIWHFASFIRARMAQAPTSLS